MNQPFAHKPGWQVFTSGEFYRDFAMDTGRWAWVAYGPRGSQSGLERRAEDAAEKAMLAAGLLSEPAPRVAR